MLKKTLIEFSIYSISAQLCAKFGYLRPIIMIDYNSPENLD